MLSFSFTDNSDYSIVNVRLEMTFKDGVTLDQIKPALGDAAEWICDESSDPLTEENVAEQIVYGESGWYEIAPGETSEAYRCAFKDYGGETLEDPAIFELLEPSILTIQYLRDGKGYIEYDDFMGESYTMSGDPFDVLGWPENDFTRDFPRPEGKYMRSVSVTDNQTYIELMDMSQEDFYALAQACKDVGYDLDPVADREWYSDVASPDGAHRVTLTSWPSAGVVTIAINTLEEG